MGLGRESDAPEYADPGAHRSELVSGTPGGGWEPATDQSWASPLPEPALFSQYDEVLPGAAERILTMAETTATGEIRILEKQADAEIDAAKRGQTLAAVLTGCAMCGSAIFFGFGNQIAGVAFLSVPLLLLIRAFLVRS